MSVHTDDLGSLLREWLDTQRSPRTVEAYERIWRKFTAHAQSEGNSFSHPRDVDARHIERYLAFEARKYAAVGRMVNGESMASRQVAIGSFLAWCVKIGHIDVNVANRLRKHKRNVLVPKPVLTPEDVTAVLKSAKSRYESAKAVRDAALAEALGWYRYRLAQTRMAGAHTRFALLSLLFTSGIRVSECAALKLRDVKLDGEHARIQFQAKGEKLVSQIIHPQTAAILRDFVLEWHECAVSDEEPLFFNPQLTGTELTHITKQSIYRMVVEVVRDAVGKKLTPHGCRATLATILAKKGIALSEIQMQLNHTSPMTTARYIRLANDADNAAALKVDLIP